MGQKHMDPVWQKPWFITIYFFILIQYKANKPIIERINAQNIKKILPPAFLSQISHD